MSDITVIILTIEFIDLQGKVNLIDTIEVAWIYFKASIKVFKHF